MKKAISIEVCVDNIESINSAAIVDIDRLELCGALAIGGITPSIGLIKYAKENTNILLHTMIKTRGGDFCYTSEEIAAMEHDVNFFADAGVDGVVIGFLDTKFDIDLKTTERFVRIAKLNDLTVTFHRAIDFVNNFNAGIKSLIELGVDRILTSGQADKAIYGLDKIAEANMEFGQKIEIMAGSGINSDNVREIIQKTGVENIHCSASKNINKFPNIQLSLGSSASSLNYSITDNNELAHIRKILYQ